MMLPNEPQEDQAPVARRVRRLDHEQVVAAAEEIVDELGWDRLTMAALATRVGTKGPSLYNHVASLDELRSELQQRTMQQLGRGLSASTMGRAGRDSFVAIGLAHLAFAQRYPHRYDGATRTPIDRDAFVAAAQDANEALLAVIRSYNVAEEDQLLAAIVIFSSMHGVVSLLTNGYIPDVVDHDALFEIISSSTERQLALLGDQRAA